VLDNFMAWNVLYFAVQDVAENKVRLSGYGVELAIKSTEYKAKDDTVITGNFAFYQLISA
jgi:hypothetical protein